MAARWALRGILARYLRANPATIEVTADGNGKPRLAGEQRALRFNLSHSQGLAVVALAREREVGVDVEWTGRERDFVRLAERELDPPTVEELSRAPAAARPQLFYAAWARREAIGKCLGVGLAAPPPGRDAVAAEIAVPAGFAGAVALEAAALPPLRRFTIDPPKAGPDRR